MKRTVTTPHPQSFSPFSGEKEGEETRPGGLESFQVGGFRFVLNEKLPPRAMMAVSVVGGEIQAKILTL